MNPQVRNKVAFATKFVGLLVIFYAVIAFHPVNDYVVVPFTATITRVAGSAVRVFDRDAMVRGTIITSSRFGIDVKNGCNAIETMALFSAAVLSFPAPLSRRLAALLIGLPALQLVNVVRLTSLFWLGTRHPDVFDVFHVAVWQVVIILIGVAMFGTWSSFVVARATVNAR